MCFIYKMVFKFLLLILYVFQTNKCAFSQELARAAILRGQLARLRQFPYVVYTSNMPKVPAAGVYGWLCTGAILTELWVVTGSHCYVGYEKKNISLDDVTTEITAGSVDVERNTSMMQMRTSQLHVKMPINMEKRESYYELYNNDVLLVKVSKRFFFNAYVGRIIIAKRPLPAGKKLTCTAVGFGLLEAPRPEQQIKLNYKLYYTSATLDGDKLSCRKRSRKIRDSRPSVWGEENVCMDPVDYRSTPCHGDSGGPLVCYGLNIGTSVGRRNVYDNNAYCGAMGNFHVYTFLGFYEDWLRKYIPELPPFKEMKITRMYGRRSVDHPKSEGRSVSSDGHTRLRAADIALVLLVDCVWFQRRSSTL